MASTAMPFLPTWAVLVASAAILSTVPLAVSRPAPVVSASLMQIHRAVSAILMAGLLLLGAESAASVPSSAVQERIATSTAMPGMSGMGIPAAPAGTRDVQLVAIVLYLLFAICVAIHEARPLRPPGTHKGNRRLNFETVEVMSMALMVALTIALA
jgi:hypothetical protein